MNLYVYISVDLWCVDVEYNLHENVRTIYSVLITHSCFEFLLFAAADSLEGTL